MRAYSAQSFSASGKLYSNLVRSPCQEGFFWRSRSCVGQVAVLDHRAGDDDGRPLPGARARPLMAPLMIARRSAVWRSERADWSV